VRVAALRGLAGLIASLALVALTSAGTAADTTQTPATGDFTGLINLPNGHRLYLECHGTGSPTVIFEAGLRSRGDIWASSRDGGANTGAFSRSTPHTHACIYDRPGTLAHVPYVSRSDPVPMPRSTGDVAMDLHALLGAAGVPGPYVLVGASTGGLIAREYARLYPGEVAGLVLVDAISEAIERFLKPPRFARYNRFYLQSPPPAAADYDALETIDFYRSFAEVRARRRPPRRTPMVVISAEFGFGRPAGVSWRFARVVNRVWKRGQRYLASLRPSTKHVIARGSGHQIHVNQPERVARQVLGVIARVRGT